MATYPLPTLAFAISSTGASAPDYADILGSITATATSIFGSDTYLLPDSQDGQLIAIVASAINDANNSGIATYNAYSPANAMGTGLSSLVKINGISRQASSNSTATVSIGGTVGTTIYNGQVQDTNGNIWDLPAVVTIPTAGTINVTATCETAGAVTADEGDISTIYTQILGWQTVTNAAAATPGAPVELDGALRQRQQLAVETPSLTRLAAIASAVAQVPGVQRSAPYENQTAATDVNGVPGHSISMVVQGGDITAIAQAILNNKSEGTGLYGTTVVPLVDPSGIPINISFFQLTQVQIYVIATVSPLTGYVSTTGAAIIAAVVAFINALPIGATVYEKWIEGAAGLIGTTLESQFVLTSLTLGTTPGPTASANIAIAFNAAAVCATGNVTVVT